MKIKDIIPILESLKDLEDDFPIDAICINKDDIEIYFKYNHWKCSLSDPVPPNEIQMFKDRHRGDKNVYT